MKLEVDYIIEFEDEQRKLNEFCPKAKTQEDEENIEQQYHEMSLMIQLANAKEAEFQKTEDSDCLKIWTDILYPFFCDLAQTQGGQVSFELDEESLVGKLKYIGHPLIINNVCCRNKLLFQKALELTDEFYITPKDELLELHFIFQVYKKNKVFDNSKEIKRLENLVLAQKQLRRMRQK